MRYRGVRSYWEQKWTEATIEMLASQSTFGVDSCVNQGKQTSLALQRLKKYLTSLSSKPILSFNTYRLRSHRFFEPQPNARVHLLKSLRNTQMLSRANSDAGKRLRRAKSSNTVANHRPLPFNCTPVDPQVSHQHALAAATVAFERAHGRLGTPGTPSAQRTRSTHGFGTSEGSRVLSRHSSFKSASNASAREGIRHRSSQTSFSARKSKADGSTKTTYVVPSVMQPAQHVTEQYGSSMPPKSLGAKLRKAQSMFNTKSNMAEHLQHDRPVNKQVSPGPQQQAAHSLAKSTRPDCQNRNISFSRPLMEGIMCDHEGQSDEDKVAMARDRYLYDIHHQRLRERPSFIKAPLKRIQDHVHTRSHYSKTGSTEESLPIVKAVPEFPDTNPMGRFEKKGMRSFSGSLKHKIKRVFRKSSNSSGNLPSQQVDAKRNYYGNGIATKPDAHEISEDTKDQDDKTALRRQSRVASHQSISFGKASTETKEISRSSSITRSEADESNSKSRVTSWNTSSTIGDAVSSNGTYSKRLSTIAEVGGSNLPRNTKNCSAVAGSLIKRGTFRNPLRKSSSVPDNEPSNHPDARRLFSALMKEIDRKANHLDELEHEPSLTTARDTLPSQRRLFSMPSHADKINQVNCGGIRSVTPDERWADNIPPNPRRLAPVPTYQLVEDNGGSAESPEGKPKSAESRLNEQLAIPRIRGRRLQKMHTESPQHMTQQADERRGRMKGPLEEERSPFFPRSPQAPVRNKDPYEWYHKDSIDSDVSIPTPDRKLATPKNVLQGAGLSSTGVVSPSIYSQEPSTPVNLIQMKQDSAVSLHTSSTSSGEPGTAIVSASQSFKRFSLTPSPSKSSAFPGQETEHSRNCDWRSWVSSEVAEFTRADLSLSNVGASPWRSGHVREQACIVDETTSENSSTKYTFGSDGPPIIPPRRHYVQNTLGERSRSRLNTRIPVSAEKITLDHNNLHESRPLGSHFDRNVDTSTNFSLIPTPLTPTTARARPSSPLRPAIAPGRITSGFAHYTSNVTATSRALSPASSLTSLSSVPGRFPRAHRPRSALDLRISGVATKSSVVDSHASKHRGRLDMGDFTNDEVMQRISQGPFASPSSTALGGLVGKENTPVTTGRGNGTSGRSGGSQQKMYEAQSPSDSLVLQSSLSLSENSKGRHTPTRGHRMADAYLSLRRREIHGQQGVEREQASESPVFL